MATANPIYIIEDVEALYPRINQPYRFDKTKGEKGLTVECDALADQAAYEMSVRMTKEKAVPLYKAMKEAYESKKVANWPAMPKSEDVFEVDPDGMYIAKTKLKAAYNNKVTEPPEQFDARNARLAKDFMLTSGSTVNCMLALIPYSMAEHGVSLRLRQVQVTKLAEMKQRSAFNVVDGGYSQSEGFATGFTAVADTAGQDFDNGPAIAVVPDAPKPQPTPVAAAAKPEAKEVKDFNDIDDALDNLDFDD